MNIQKIDINLLKPAEYNPRKKLKKTDKEYIKIKNSIEKFGYIDPIILNKDFTVIGGHQRLTVLKDLKYKEIDCVIVDISKEEEKALNIGLNKISGEWDKDLLKDLFLDLKLTDIDLNLAGFDDVEISKLIGEELKAEEDDFEVPNENEIKTDIALGDLFEIGEHRLLCGDSTNPDSVAKLMNGEKPILMVTDPPYGVEYDADWRNKAMRKDGTPIGGQATGKVSNDDNADWTEAWKLSPSLVAYVWHAGKYAGIFQNSLESCDFIIISQIIWNKSNFAISRGDYHWKHEPCWYAVKKNSKHYFIAGRNQCTVWDIPKPSKSDTGHSTQKHIKCMSIPIENHDGDVHDPFLGSGTTMVAAHQLKRRCFGMEFNPKYCQIIVDRMRKLDPTLVIKKNGVTI